MRRTVARLAEGRETIDHDRSARLAAFLDDVVPAAVADRQREVR